MKRRGERRWRRECAAQSVPVNLERHLPPPFCPYTHTHTHTHSPPVMNQKRDGTVLYSVRKEKRRAQYAPPIFGRNNHAILGTSAISASTDKEGELIQILLRLLTASNHFLERPLFFLFTIFDVVNRLTSLCAGKDDA